MGQRNHTSKHGNSSSRSIDCSLQHTYSLPAAKSSSCSSRQRPWTPHPLVAPVRGSSPQGHLTPGSSSLALLVFLGACGLAYLWFSAKTKYRHALACLDLGTSTHVEINECLLFVTTRSDSGVYF